MTRATSLLTCAAALCVLSTAAWADTTTDDKTYELRYQFKPGETIRWRVVHLSKVKTTVAGTTQTAESVSKSLKAWKVTDVTDTGTATFQHMVEEVDMRSKLTGRQEVTYNSRTDDEAPVGYESMAESVGVVLSVVTIDPWGKVISRKDQKQSTVTPNKGQITMPLPKDPVKVGETWSFPHDIVVPGNDGTVHKINARQKFTLASVKNGVASIEMVTVILTPVRDPAVEAQVIQQQSQGTVRFDIAAGRVLGQQMDLDKRVVGFAGKTDTSSLHYITRFTEDLVIGTETVANADAKTTAAKKAEALK